MTRTWRLMLLVLLLTAPARAQSTCPEGTYHADTETQGKVRKIICKCLPGRTLVGGKCIAAAPSSQPAIASLISETEEAELGRRSAAALEGTMTFVTDPRVTAYVEGVFNKIVRHSPRPGVAYRVRVCINCGACGVACSLGGGSVYVSTRFIRLVSHEGELAAVLAHEVGHVAARHSARGFDDAFRATAVAVLNGGPIAPIVQRALSMKYSRDNESEADRLAVEMLYRAGIRPTALTTSFEKLRREEERARLGRTSPTLVDPFAAAYFSTHSSLPERMSSIAPLLADPRFNTLRTNNSPDFQTAQSRLPPP
jgi:predicted Zn-dependent protease